ncbi:undecaprenyl-diphosphate phosphatase [Patescibacteria group bacterium]|nr:undecaprenyl-diphosphate phosphatase [Patescibacteria group bacterium]
MSYSQAIILAVVQGLTEFLPVSSSGHLVIFQKLFNLAEPPVLFDILVHVGTLGAILVYFRKELVKISRKTVWLILIGTIPAAIVGLFLQSYISQIFNSLKLVGVALLVTAGLLLLSQRFTSSAARRHWSPQLRRRRSSTATNKESLSRRAGGFFKSLNRRFDSLKWQDAIFVGCFQAFAIIPGISRSGATIVSGLWRRFDRQTAFQFSFYLAIPAIFGALLLQIPDLIYSPCSYLGQGFLGMVIAGLVGYGALRILEKTLLNAKFWLFGIYCLILGIIVLLV